jgi:hypothetical protein
VWLEMGSPTYPNSGQLKTLMKASETLKERISYTEDENGVIFDLSLPPHSVTALYINY